MLGNIIADKFSLNYKSHKVELITTFLTRANIFEV